MEHGRASGVPANPRPPGRGPRRQARLHAEGDLYDPILEEAHVAYPRHVEPAETSPAVLSAIAAMPAAVPPRQKRRRRRQAEEVPEKLARLLF